MTSKHKLELKKIYFFLKKMRYVYHLAILTVLNFLLLKIVREDSKTLNLTI